MPRRLRASNLYHKILRVDTILFTINVCVRILFVVSQIFFSYFWCCKPKYLNLSIIFFFQVSKISFLNFELFPKYSIFFSVKRLDKRILLHSLYVRFVSMPEFAGSFIQVRTLFICTFS